MPLSAGLHAAEDGHAAVLVKANTRLVRPIVSTGLYVGCDANAAELPSRARFLEPLPKRPPTPDFLRSRKMRGKLAGVVGLPRRGRMRHACDEIPPPQLIRSEPNVARRHIQKPLDQIGRFGTTGSPIRIDRGRIGERAAHANVTGGHVVNPRSHAGTQVWDERRVGGQIGAHIGDKVDGKREKAAVAIERQLCAGLVRAAVSISKKMLRALRYPFDRALELGRGERRKRVFAVSEKFCAEPASDIRRNDTHHFRSNPEYLFAKHIADRVASLTAQRQRDARTVVFGHHGTSIEIIGDDALVDDLDRGYVGGLGKCGGRRAAVAELCLEGNIAIDLGPHAWSMRRKRSKRPDHMRKRLPFDTDGICGIPRARQGIGNHKCDGIADIARLILRECRIRRNCDFGIWYRDLAGQIAKHGCVRSREHERNAWHGADSPEIRNAKPRVGMRRANDHGVQQTSGHMIRHIMPFPTKQSRVLLAGDCVAYAEFHGMYCSLRANMLGT